MTELKEETKAKRENRRSSCSGRHDRLIDDLLPLTARNLQNRPTKGKKKKKTLLKMMNARRENKRFVNGGEKLVTDRLKGPVK